MKKIVAFFLIFAIATLSILPTTVYSQTKVNQDIFESKQNNLKTILEKEKLNRFNSLLDNTIENASPIDTNSNFLKNTPMLRSYD